MIGLSPDDAYTYYRRGLAQRTIGHSDKAIPDMHTCLKLSKDPELRRSAELVLQELNATP